MPLKQQNSSLGRGLSSLIPQKKVDSASDLDEVMTQSDSTEQDSIVMAQQDGDALAKISITKISANPLQPRSKFEMSALEELTQSIKTHGIIQPIVVTQKDNGRYEIIVGERRFRAAKRAGLNEVPAIIRNADNQQKLELALIENIVREDLNPIELALAYQKYVEDFELTHDDAAARLGKSRSVITNTIRLLQLPKEIQEAVQERKISDAHAKVIIGLATPEQQIELYKRILGRGLSVNRTRHETQKMGGTKEARLKINPQDEEMEKKLRQYLGTRVSIQRSGYRGKILIEFFNYDEMLDIVGKILGEE